jgi:hypothetical protein
VLTTIDKLFHIVYGQREYHNKEWLEGTEGPTILISSKGEDNGLYGFFDIESKFKAPIITVQGYGTIGHAFVQEYDCAVDDHMLILIPKKKLSLEELYQIAYQIRLTKWKYRYGRGITPGRLKHEKINIVKSKINYKKLAKEITPKSVKRQAINSKIKFNVFKLKQLFKIEKGAGHYLETLDLGKTPVVSTQMSDCGICGFYDIEPSFKKGCITVGRIMCNPHVQIQDFSTVPDDIFVLTPYEGNTKEFLFYASSFIKTERWRFNYCRKVTKEKLEELNIRLPIRDNAIDYDYIRNIATNSYGYEEIKEYL